MHQSSNRTIVLPSKRKQINYKMKLKKPSLPAKYQNKVKLSRKSLVIAASVVVIIIGAGTALYIKHQNDSSKKAKVDCSQLVAETDRLLLDNKPGEAYSKLKPQEGDCGNAPTSDEVKDPNKTAQTLTIMQFNGNLARAAYLSDNKGEGKAYAQKVLDINKNLAQFQRNQLPNRSGFFFDMDDILQDQYQAYPIKRKLEK